MNCPIPELNQQSVGKAEQYEHKHISVWSEDEGSKSLVMGAVSAPYPPDYSYALIPCVQAYFNDVMVGRNADVELKTWCNWITT